MVDEEKLQILLVEDTHSLAKMLKAFIEQQGHQVEHVTSGEAAVQSYRKHTPDLVLMDIIMPGMGGIEATRQIKALHRPHWVPLIIMTVLGNDEDIIAGLNAGADEYLTKPIRLEVLAARMDAMRRIARMQIALDNAREEIVRNERMASVGYLAAGVAHEMNTPLGALGSNINALLAELPPLMQLAELSHNLLPLLPADQADKLRLQLATTDTDYLRNDLPALSSEMKSSLERMHKVVDSLRQLTRPGEPGRQHVDLAETLDHAMELLGHRFSPNVQIRRDYGSLAAIDCIPAQLSQAFSNILINAAQAMATGGELTLSAKGDAEAVTVTISDNGPGISPEHLSHVFDPFFTTHDVGEGSGLGLYVARRIIAAHGGKIVAESTLGNGCRISMKFPRTDL